MPLTIGFTYDTNTARHGSPSVRFMPNGTVELWRERAMYPKLEVTHVDATGTVESVGNNYLLWSIVYDNGDELTKCPRCPKNHMLGFKRKQPPQKMVEWGTPVAGGFVCVPCTHENPKNLAPDVYRGSNSHVIADAPSHEGGGSEHYPVVRYRDLRPEGSRHFKAFLGCNSHFHGHHLFQIKIQFIELNEAGEIIRSEIAYSPRIKVVSKFLEKKGTKALKVEEVQEKMLIESVCKKRKLDASGNFVAVGVKARQLNQYNDHRHPQRAIKRESGESDDGEDDHDHDHDHDGDDGEGGDEDDSCDSNGAGGAAEENGDSGASSRFRHKKAKSASVVARAVSGADQYHSGGGHFAVHYPSSVSPSSSSPSSLEDDQRRMLSYPSLDQQYALKLAAAANPQPNNTASTVRSRGFPLHVGNQIIRVQNPGLPSSPANSPGGHGATVAMMTTTTTTSNGAATTHSSSSSSSSSTAAAKSSTRHRGGVASSGAVASSSVPSPVIPHLSLPPMKTSSAPGAKVERRSLTPSNGNGNGGGCYELSRSSSPQSNMLSGGVTGSLSDGDNDNDDDTQSFTSSSHHEGSPYSFGEEASVPSSHMALLGSTSLFDDLFGVGGPRHYAESSAVPLPSSAPPASALLSSACSPSSSSSSFSSSPTCGAASGGAGSYGLLASPTGSQLSEFSCPPSASVPSSPALTAPMMSEEATVHSVVDGFTRLCHHEKMAVLQQICSSSESWSALKRFVLQQAQGMNDVQYDSDE